MATARAAVQLYHILRVDKELKPNDSFTAYRIDDKASPDTLDIRISCTTVRQLRLSVNAIMENVALVVETMEAFGPVADAGGELTRETALPDAEFELSGTGRAG